mmetsp:Transcript_27441/g.40529  ORF Transcript_27441/g.40529 Transcript_27441/m.40529 type:complete len:333 (-) Transcript_27441:50-1048(-)
MPKIISLFAISICFCLVANLVSSSRLDSSTSLPSFSKPKLSSPLSWLQNRWKQSCDLAELEQKVEDYNAAWVASAETANEGLTRRRLICLPLNERFNPPMGAFSHDHVQTGDKISAPSVFWQAIDKTKAEVPWLMRVERVTGWTGERFSYEKEDYNDTDESSDDEEEDSDVEKDSDSKFDVDIPKDASCHPGTLDSLVAGPLDFRAPQNYCFLPWWMMRALGLQPRDIVDVSLVTTIPPGSAARFRPHSSDFSKDISNPQAVMETELKHYSSLTKGTVIAFDYNKKRYWFDVVDLRSAPHGEKRDIIKVQDCDVATDFLPAKDTLKKRRTRK